MRLLKCVCVLKCGARIPPYRAEQLNGGEIGRKAVNNTVLEQVKRSGHEDTEGEAHCCQAVEDGRNVFRVLRSNQLATKHRSNVSEAVRDIRG